MPTRRPVHVPSHGDGSDTRRASDRDRGTRSERGYDALWQRFRRFVLSRHPLCADCRERSLIIAATEVHHIEKVRDRPDLRLDPTNVRALCKPCHSARTAQGE